MSLKKVKTANITAQLQKVSQDEQINVSKLHFYIHKTDTYIKSIQEPEFVLYNQDIHEYFTNPTKLIDEHIELKQLHSIEIDTIKSSMIGLKYKIITSTNKTEADIIISPESMLPFKSIAIAEFYKQFIQELNHTKAQNMMLINIFDNDMKEQLKTLVKYIYAEKFTKPLKINLIKTIEPIGGDDGGLHLLFLEKKKEDTKLIEVDEGEILAIYEKPRAGTNGLNIYGQMIDSNLVSHHKDIQAYVDTKSIEILMQDQKKIYKSKLKGFVELNENNFYVDNVVKLGSVSRLQQQLVKQEQNSIEVVVTQDDTNLDSVGDGAELISQTIHIAGHVGAKSIIKAQELIIDGATHSDSIQEAKFANINRHKGKLRCHSAKINLLEGGIVYATNVEINESLSGAIYAENVTINRVKHNLKVYASNSITIKSISGENNLFKISYRDIPTLIKKVEFMQSDLDDLRDKLESAKKHSIDMIPFINDKIIALKKDISTITQSSLDAKITIKGNINSINTIIFVLENNEELIYKTTLNSYEPFHIAIDGDYAKLIPTNKQVKLK